ncbi:MAG: hypothetical protein KGM98_00295 [Bacteroidota bacterium]|nr:hypothetical protein [Bacteroidota bacterium]
MKNSLYKNPVVRIVKEGREVSVYVDISSANTLMGIYLRDRFLEAHSEQFRKK